MNAGDRKGFTLIELVIVSVLSLLVLLAAQRVLITNTNAYAVMSQRIQSRQTVRAGMDILFAELRELSPSGGDLVLAGNDFVTIRSMTGFGVACAVDLDGTPRLRVRRDGRPFESGDSIFVFADADEKFSSDDTWILGVVGTSDTTSVCPSGDPAQLISIPGAGSAMRADTVRVGAAVRSFTNYRYALYEAVPGEWYLGRGPATGTLEPLVGPLRPPAQNGLVIEYLDVDGNTAPTPADVAQFQVTIRSAPGMIGPDGRPVADSLVTRVYPRN